MNAINIDMNIYHNTTSIKQHRLNGTCVKCHSHPGLAMEFSGSSRLTLRMYRAQVRIFSEKLNSRILRPGGGRRGKAHQLNNVCLNICSARPPAATGLFSAPPALPARVVFISFTLVWRASRLFEKSQSASCLEAWSIFLEAREKV